jgi:hypothetical protein
MVFLVLILAVWANPLLALLRYLCTYMVAAFVIISGLNYSIVVARKLHAGG